MAAMAIAGCRPDAAEPARPPAAVAAGVRLAGRPVGGLSPAELTAVVQDGAARLYRAPLDAAVDPVTGGLWPALAGQSVDVEETCRRVLAAPPGTDVDYAFTPVPPAVDNAAFPLAPIYRGRPEKNEVALTVNVAWGQDYLPSMLRILKERGVQVTFFVQGDWAEKFPRLVEQMAADGHEIGSHGYSHPHMAVMSDAEIAAEISHAGAILKSITGQEPTLFAPPYGEVTRQILFTAARLGYRTSLWSCDTIDWRGEPPDVILARFQKRVTAGAIVLMHPTPATVQALPLMLDYIEKQGWRPVTVTKLISPH